MGRTELHWVCNSPSPYNSDLFRVLASESEFDLTVHYHQHSISSHPWQSNLTEGYRSRGFTTYFGIDWKLIRLALSRPKPGARRIFVIAGWNHPTSIVLLLVLGLGMGRYLIWTDTPNPNRQRNLWFAVLRSLLLKWSFRRSFRVMGTGQPALNALRLMGAPPEKLVNFPYWIDLSKYVSSDNTRRQSRDTSRPIRFLSSGRIQNAMKGHDIAIRALGEQERKWNNDFEYRIAGSGEDEYALRGLLEELGIGDHVELLGWLEPEQLLDELASADALIHPSPVHEPYGVAIIEAMAAGLVVLASDVTCAALDRIEHGVNGYIHNAGDVKELAVQIGELMDDPARLAIMGQRARSTAERWPLERAVRLIRELAGEIPRIERHFV